MRKIIKLTESDLVKLIKRVISEDEAESPEPDPELYAKHVNKNVPGTQTTQDVAEEEEEYEEKKYRRSPRMRGSRRR